MPGAYTSQCYTDIKQNIYNEIDTMHYLDPVDSTEKNNENIRQEKSEEKRDKRAREKSSLLSLLMRRSNNCQFDMTDRGYTDIIESDLGVNPPISTRTTRTMTTSEPPPRTNTKITTGPSTRLPGKGKRKTRPQTPPVIKEQTTTHPLLALTIRTPSPPGTNFKAKTITKPSSVAPKKPPRFPFLIKPKLTQQLATQAEKTKPASVHVEPTPSENTPPPQSPNTTDATSETAPPQITTNATTHTPQPTTTVSRRRQEMSGKMQQIISFYQTVHRTE